MIKSESRGDVAVLTLDRDEKRNALSTELLRTLSTAFAAAHGARAIVLTGAGTVFSAGADLDEDEFDGSFFEHLFSLIDAIRSSRAPVIAYINGPAIGAGMMLSMACDIRVAARSARFLLPVGDMAIGVNEWVVRSLAEHVGASRARLMLIGGAPMDLDTAVSCGFAIGGTLERTLELADLVAVKAPLTMQNIKAEFAPDLFTAPQREAALRAPFGSDDIREVGRARAEGRRPTFTGR